MLTRLFVNRRLELHLLLVAIGMAALLGFIARNAYLTHRAYSDAEARYNRISEQLRYTNRFMVVLLNAQAGQRGFLITQRERYLEPYIAGMKSIDHEFDMLRSVYASEPDYHGVIDEIGIVKSSVSELFANSIAMVRQGRAAEARDLVMTDRAKALMDRVRVLYGGLLSKKRAELGRISADLTPLKQRSKRSLTALIASIFLFMGAAYAVLFADLTEQRRLKKRLEDAQHIDALTGLPNATYFDSIVANVLKQSSRDRSHAAILVVDMDNFDRINDRFGYEYGNRLLKSVANRLKQMARKNDVLARLEGDAFAFVAPNVAEIKEIEFLAVRIIQSLAPPLLPALHNEYIGASVGISLYPDDAIESQALLLHAIHAVKQAKQDGKHRYHFYQSNTGTPVTPSNPLLHALHAAVQSNQFVLQYQPQFDTASGAMVGAEALLRWGGAGYGEIGPDEFIPVLEDSRLIIPLGSWILHQSCHQAARWKSNGCPIRLAVNVSVLELVASQYVQTVSDALHASGLPAGLLEIEVTERALINAEARQTLAAVRELGVKIALDDFGTGYSSLQYLLEFPVDYIKIDKVFIAGLPFVRGNLAIVRGIIAMARDLHIKVLAEGVETVEQIEQLRHLHCTVAQGFYYFPAMAADEIETIYQESLVHK